MNVPLLDLQAQFQPIEQEVLAAVGEVFRTQRFILGPGVQACEAAVAEYSACAHGVGVSSGTDALLIALMAEEVGPGDEVITTPYTFFSTAGSIARLGARPVFVDIDPVTFNIDPLQIEARVSAKTRAILPVHLYGQTADMEPILDIARRHNIVVIEDAAQAIGAEYKGQRAGSMGHYGCFSFFPSKNLGCAGDGGMVVTQVAARAERLTVLRAHGSKPKYYHHFIGGNFRLDALQAEIVTVKLKYLDQWTAGRQANAERYRRLFTESGVLDAGRVVLPETGTDRHIFNQFVLRASNRDGLLKHLREKKIGCEVYYPVPLHLQDCFKYLGHAEGDLPQSEKAARETVAIPIYPELSDEQAAYVVDTIAGFYR